MDPKAQPLFRSFMSKEIVLIGRSNVGKSTLFRELTGRNVRIGRRPGVTISPTKVLIGDVIYVDMPGYGFMSGVSAPQQKKTKDFIIRYFEENAENLLLIIEVIDASAFMEIANRWEKRGRIPLEVELYEFLCELGPPVVIGANKMDKVSDPDETLDEICATLGMLPPWRQWINEIAPICAKRGDTYPLLKTIREKIQSTSR